MASPVEQIKEKLDIAAVVSSYIKIDKAGGNYRARCPFHNEKTPSFFVSPSRETWHCFGCNKGGDIFSFVEEIEGVDFSGALKTLADKAGVILRRGNPEERTEKGRLYALLADAALFFRRELRKNSEALEYLKKRGLTGETIDEFEVGFAPREWRALGDHLSEKGYSQEEQEKAGMIIHSAKPESRSRYYDRFRSRIMFPLSDSSGRVVAFSGRIFGEEADSGEHVAAKYINSPETPLYNKSKILYGFDKAKNAIREAGFCIIVEGQMDLLMAHQAGTKNAVAVSGTALTEHHLENLKRFSETLVLLFDADTAGISATAKTARSALFFGFSVQAVSLPKGMDPADLILQLPEKWEKSIAERKHVVEFFLESLEKRNLDRRALQKEAGKYIVPFIACIANGIEQSHWTHVVSEKIGVSENAMHEEVKKESTRPHDEAVFKNNVSVKPPFSASTRKEALERKIQGVILWQKSLSKPEFSDEELTERYKKIAAPDIPSRQDEESTLIFEAETFYGGTDALAEHIEELFLNFEKEVRKEQFTEAMTELRRAEALHDTERELALLQKCKDLSERLKKLGNV